MRRLSSPAAATIMPSASTLLRPAGILQGKVAIVTGSNTGIGKEVAGALYEAGAKVIVACRSKSKADKAIEELCQRRDNDDDDDDDDDDYHVDDSSETSPWLSSGSGGDSRGSLMFMELDLSSFASVEAFATKFKSMNIPLHILVCNAGINAYTARKMAATTDDGFNTISQVNFLSHFLLIERLLELLKTSAPSRIVNVSSSVHRLSRMPLSEQVFYQSSLNGQYSFSKLCMVQLARFLQRKHAGSGISIHSCNPGAVKSDIWRDLAFHEKMVISPLKELFFITPAQAAFPIVAASASPEFGDESSRYFNPYWCPRASGKIHGVLHALFDFVGVFEGACVRSPSQRALSDEEADKLYSLCERLVLQRRPH